jgi:hypothetical protein
MQANLRSCLTPLMKTLHRKSHLHGTRRTNNFALCLLFLVTAVVFHTFFFARTRHTKDNGFDPVCVQRQKEVDFQLPEGFQQRRAVVLTTCKSKLPHHFTASMISLLEILPKAVVFVGVGKSFVDVDFPVTQDWLHIIPVPEPEIKMKSRTAQYSGLRNSVYAAAVKVINISAIDYIVISDADMSAPITTTMWKSNFAFNFDWDIMTANGQIDRTHVYYDMFALRTLDQPLSPRISNLCPTFKKLYGKSFDWAKPIRAFKKVTRVKTAHGGVSIFNGKSWQAVVGGSYPFDEGIAYDTCEHVPLQSKFSRVYVNPHMIYYHAYPHVLPYDRYKLIVPRDAGFFSVLNFVMAGVTTERVYPLWRKDLIMKVNGKSVLRHFVYLGNNSVPNAWLLFFEPVEFFDGDKTMMSQHFDVIEKEEMIVKEDYFPREFIFPLERNFMTSHSFAKWRIHMHKRYQCLIKPKSKFKQLSKQVFQHPSFKIGVHVRSPLHFVETGPIYMKQYFNTIDAVLLLHPDAVIFVATDTEYALQAMISRYGARVIFHRFVERARLDDLFSTLFTLATKGAELDTVGQIHLASGEILGTELHTTRDANSLLGRDVLVDALSLSLCDVVVGTSSNVMIALSFMNPLSVIHFLNSSTDPKSYDFRSDI